MVGCWLVGNAAELAVESAAESATSGPIGAVGSLSVGVMESGVMEWSSAVMPTLWHGFILPASHRLGLNLKGN